MADFYSVLKSSITKRDLRSPADRQEVYEQARAAMVRKLWTLDPPLSEDEIDTRIGLFDDAVRRIEADLQKSFVSQETSDEPINQRRERAPAGPLPEPPAREPPADDGKRQRVSPESPGGDRSARPLPPRQAAYRSASDRTPPPGRDIARLGAERQAGSPRDEQVAVADAYDEPDEAWFSGEYNEDREHETRSQVYDDATQYRQPAQATPGYDDSAYGESAYDRLDDDDRYQDPYRQTGAPETLDGYAVYEDDPYRHGRARDAHAGRHSYEVDDQPDAPRSTARRRARTRSDWDDASADAAYDYELEARETDYEPTPRQPPRRRARKRGRPQQKRKTRGQPRRVGRKIGQILAIVAGVCAVVLIAYVGYVFLPILSGSDPVRQVADTAPPKSNDRVPTTGAATAAARIASDSATATEIPERNLDVAESLVIFSGDDPTVFEGSSNNPIHFDSDSEGGFARISSAASAAGARAVIGPGLAERLAGQTVRVTLLARSSSENGAATLRFAYQTGLAVSHWQNADLASSYSTYGMIWRVPATHTASGDFLLIEPGIPGDGTSTDIRQITIDILAS